MRQERLDLRASPKERQRFLETAVFSGMTLSGFLRKAALEKSNIVLKSKNTLTLSNRDRDIFLDALENPLKANKHLQKAFKTYQKRKENYILKSMPR